MTRLGWQWRERGSGGAPYRQRVSLSEPPAPAAAELLTLIEHETNCTACQLQSVGAYCPVAARLIRAEREARR
ncbi:hypothetical protein ACFCXP_04520 [Streptomyces niveus]|uniref:hypothetical protein n=1 Tax=Streptomyces niveus TaxID=193462 RepID=UPI0035D58F5A